MKIGEFFISLGVKGDTKELDKTNEKLEKSEKIGKKATDGFKALRSSVLKFTGGLTIAYNVIDRVAMSLAKANQQMINFQRQTGLSFETLNKYASASASVSATATIEGTAQSMQRVAQNLWDIRMGRGDISPYQELAFVGGNAFNPAGMSVEEVIENLREAIKNVADVPATNIITRMGFSPDDLLMLRMTKEELAEINNLFLDEQSREALYKYGLQMRKVDLQLALVKDNILLKLMPAFVSLKTQVGDSISTWVDLISNSKQIQFALKGIGLIFAGWAVALNPVIAGLTALYLILEDIAFWYMGHESITGDIFGKKGSVENKINTQLKPSVLGLPNLLGQLGTLWYKGFRERFDENGKYIAPPISAEARSKNFTQNNEINITTTEKADKLTANNIIEYTALASQFA